MMKWIIFILLSTIAVLLSAGHTKEDVVTSPQAGARTYALNYKDMVLAICITSAYKNEDGAAIDAGSSVSALRDWTYYDMEKVQMRSNPWLTVT
jgi:hypothetical protein